MAITSRDRCKRDGLAAPKTSRWREACHAALSALRARPCSPPSVPVSDCSCNPPERGHIASPSKAGGRLLDDQNIEWFGDSSHLLKPRTIDCSARRYVDPHGIVGSTQANSVNAIN